MMNLRSKLLIVVPSKGRAQNIVKNVLPLVTQFENIDYKIFIENEDLQDYKKQVNESNLVILQKSNQGIGYSLSEAKKYALQNNYKYIFKIDDDVQSIGSIYEDIDLILDTLENNTSIGMVVFPYAHEFYSVDKTRLFSALNKRAQTCYLVKTALFQANPHFCYFEDFGAYKQLVDLGYKSIFCCKHDIKCNTVGSNKGGLQSFDRKLGTEKEIILWKKIDPTIKFVIKPDKPWFYEIKLSKKYQSIKL